MGSHLKLTGKSGNIEMQIIRRFPFRAIKSRLEKANLPRGGDAKSWVCISTSVQIARLPKDIVLSAVFIFSEFQRSNGSERRKDYGVAYMPRLSLHSIFLVIKGGVKEGYQCRKPLGQFR